MEPVDQRRKRRTFREVMQTYGKIRAGNRVLTVLWKMRGENRGADGASVIASVAKQSPRPKNCFILANTAKEKSTAYGALCVTEEFASLGSQ
jgi:hypothetical protein